MADRSNPPDLSTTRSRAIVRTLEQSSYVDYHHHVSELDGLISQRMAFQGLLKWLYAAVVVAAACTLALIYGAVVHG